MGLFLTQEEMWDRPLGGNSKERQIPHWFGNIAYVIVGGIFKIAFRYKVNGRESLRALNKKCGAVVVCNHTSFLDVAFIYLAARLKQWVRIIGRESLFDNGHGLAGQILSRVGAFPIKRDSADRSAIKRAARMLKNQELVGILPEGTRRNKGSKTPELHAGAAFIARMGGGVPILPMTVRNAEQVKEKGKRIRFPKITVEYGTPILLEEFDFLEKDLRLEGCTWYAMRECFALFYETSVEQVDMKSLFPDATDFTDIFKEHPIPKYTTEQVIDKYLSAHSATKLDGNK